MASAKTQSLKTLRRNQWRDVPEQSGIYRWYFPSSCLRKLSIADHCDPKSLMLRRSESGKVCLYVGIATSLRQRVKWHASQTLLASALRSGFLSTFRFTLLALNDIDYATGLQAINDFFDRLEIAWQTTPNLEAAKERESRELSGKYHFPLNIQGNKCPELREYVRFVKRRRKKYKRAMLID